MDTQQRLDELQHEAEQLGFGYSLRFNRHEHRSVLEGVRLHQTGQSMAYCARMLRHVTPDNIERAIEVFRQNGDLARAAQIPKDRPEANAIDNMRWWAMESAAFTIVDRLVAISLAERAFGAT